MLDTKLKDTQSSNLKALGIKVDIAPPVFVNRRRQSPNTSLHHSSRSSNIIYAVKTTTSAELTKVRAAVKPPLSEIWKTPFPDGQACEGERKTRTEN